MTKQLSVGNQKVLFSKVIESLSRVQSIVELRSYIYVGNSIDSQSAFL